MLKPIFPRARCARRTWTRSTEVHIFFIALLVVVGLAVAAFAGLTVGKLYKGQN
jgi:hypothetical protein